ncbi:MAG TPA: DUF4040 domain-containing protein, partial [Ignavibacteria bacterium]|nr:DUF4040 domain-containing protein [Ignavibacteria bacterium]
LIAGFKPFIGEYHKEKFSIKNNFLIPSGVLAYAGFLFIFIYPFLSQSLLAPAAASVLGIAVNFDLSLLYGFNWVLILGILILAGGYYAFKYKKIFYIHSPQNIKNLRPVRIFEISFKALKDACWYVTKSFQSGKLSRYVIYILTVSVMLIAISFLYFGGLSFNIISFNAEYYEILPAVIGIASALVLIFLKSRMTSIILLGVTGYSVSLIYLMYGAPDLALTQFIVETLTVIFFTLVMLKLPKISKFSSVKRRVRDFIISFIFAAAVCIILLQVADISFDANLSSFFANNSLILAKGKNIVNTIIVDFRALDTFGEIVVLTIAAFGIFALLKFNARKKL